MRSLSLVLVGLLSMVAGAAAQERAKGLRFLDEQSYRAVPLAATPLMGQIPPAADMSANFPTPGDQGAQASCVGWAVAYALKSSQEHVERRWPLDSQDRLFSPAFIYNQIAQSGNCMGGSDLAEALNLLRREGVATLADFPYSDQMCDRVPDARIKQSAQQFAVADWRRVNVLDETEVKTQLAAGFPVVIGMMVDNAFQNLFGDAVYTTPDNVNPGGHAMVVVGYDDARSAFKVINSWGTYWGDGGFGWIGYAAFREKVLEGYVVQDIVVVKPDTPVPPSPQPQPPQPQPPQAVDVQLGLPLILHNVSVPVQSYFGTAPGMQITVPGVIRGGGGHTITIQIRFNYLNGPPLYANTQEFIYRDGSGLVTVSSLSTPVGTDYELLAQAPLLIPYYALNFPPTNGMNFYQLALTASVYVDNQLVAQSPFAPFNLRW